MGEMSFDFPPALLRWIEEQVAGGRYADAADYVCDLIRRDRDAAKKGSDNASHRSFDAR